MTSPEGANRLGEAMNRRRIDLDMNWREVAAATKLTYEGLRGIRIGSHNPSERTARHLEDALQWEHGSIDAVLGGGEPTPADPDAVDTEPRIRTLESREHVPESLSDREAIVWDALTRAGETEARRWELIAHMRGTSRTRDGS